MAKLAVILFLFALCAVAMAARIAREEPTKKPSEQFQEQFNNLAAQVQNFFQNPELKKSLEDLANNVKDATKKLTDNFQAQVSEAPKALV